MFYCPAGFDLLPDMDDITCESLGKNPITSAAINSLAALLLHEHMHWNYLVTGGMSCLGGRCSRGSHKLLTTYNSWQGLRAEIPTFLIGTILPQIYLKTHLMVMDPSMLCVSM